jgi:uncharacterized membrane protein
MDYLLIIVLGIVVLSIWNSNRDAHEQVREAVDRLEREIDFLRSQLAGLVKANGKPAQAASEPATSKPAQQQEPLKAAHDAASPVAPFTPPAEPKPAVSTPPASPVVSASPMPGPTPPPVAPPEKRIARSDEQHREPEPAPAMPLRPAAPFQAAQVPSNEEPAQAGSRIFSLEETLGANWLNKLGIAILVIGLAFFLAYKLQTWGPGGKVLCGFAVSAALLGGGIWLERKPTYRIFARGGIGGGWALAYFTTFAMYHLQAARILDSLPVDLVLMLLVAAGMVGHSLRYRSQTITSLAFLLGFGTLLTSHVEQPDQTVVFSLAASAILAIALVVVTTIRHWAVLELCGLVAVYVSHFVWLGRVLPEDHSAFAQFWPSTLLILLYWLIFRLAYVMRTPLDQREENLSSASAILNSGGVLALLKFQSVHPEWAFWALAVLGILEMGLAYWAKAKRRQAFVVLSTIAVVLLISSVPFRFHGVSWPVLWLVQAQVLAIAGLRLGEPVFRRLGLLTGLITGGVLALYDVVPLAMERLLAPDNSRHWSLTAGLALAALLYWTHAEVYPRRWPEIEASAVEGLALKVTSWLGLGAAATCLWVVVPDEWLPLGWIALFLALVVAGHRFGASMPPLEGDVLAILTAGVLAFHHVLPLVFFRFENTDASRHPVETVVLSLAALAFWTRAELFRRVLPKLSALPSWDPAAWEGVILPIFSCLGTAAAAAALWVALPERWVAVGWLLLVVALGLSADGIASVGMALQSDVLALLAWFTLVAEWGGGPGDWKYRTPMLVAVALFYCGMRRKTVVRSRNHVPAAYSWAAAVLLVFLTFDIFHDPWVAPVLAALCMAVFEIGRVARKGFLRWQSYALLAIAFARYLFSDLWNAVIWLAMPSAAKNFTFVGSDLLEVLILIACGYWLMEGTRGTERVTKAEHVVGLFADAIGTFCLAVWFLVLFPFYVRGGEGWIAAIWAAMAAVLMALAWILRRRTFMVQAIALALASVLRGLLFDLAGESGGDFWHGPLYRLSVAALALVAALPFAFRLRGPVFWEGASPPEPAARALRHPEQWFFFAPFGMMVAALAAELSSGHITIAWSLLGLGTFLFALAVGERSFRLAGLGLLLVSVAKILVMDVWKLASPDRYTTLIVLGLALLTVSFLYTRFSTTIRKYL